MTDADQAALAVLISARADIDRAIARIKGGADDPWIADMIDGEPDPVFDARLAELQRNASSLEFASMTATALIAKARQH